MLLSIIVTILAFGIMVILHELGHFLTAKKFGVTVYEFSVGMGPVLLKRQKGDTQYSVRLFPLGGFVRLEGEDEESDNPRAFSNISPLKRICILAAGAIMNIMLGLLCFIVINNIHGFVTTTEIYSVLEDSAAYEAGLKPGDEIVKLDNTNVKTFADVKLFMLSNPQDVKVTYIRDGEKYNVTLSPKVTQTGEKLIGYQPAVKELSFLETLEYSYYDTRYVIKAVMVSLKMLFVGEAKVADMSGPVGIVQVVDDTAQATKHAGALYVFLNLLNLFAMISVNLGVFNLLPFPALDGGSIIFATAELVTRKKLKPEILGYINLIGLALILALGVFVMYSDIMKLF